MSKNRLRQVACPHCGIATPFGPDQAFRPFCSERCKMIDLGHWAAEDYQLPEIEKPALESEPPPQ